MGKTTRLTTEEFIKRSKEIYGNKYDYSKVKYINNKTKVCIICPEHGEFLIMPSHFLNGHICKSCALNNRVEKIKYKKEDFIEKASKKHNNKYDYSKIEYKDIFTKVCIICPEHGEFWQTPYMHIYGQGCSECGGVKRLDTKLFIEKAKSIHGDRYDYSKVNYINSKTKVCIICPEHGEFWQTPNDHLGGHGCGLCNLSHLENEMEDFLNDNGIKYISQAKKNKCDKLSFLGRLSLDFYLPDYNIAIECQGIQHFKCSKSKKSFYNEEIINKTIERDVRKKRLCADNNVKILYYSNLGITYPYKVFEDKNNLLIEILKNGKKLD